MNQKEKRTRQSRLRQKKEGLNEKSSKNTFKTPTQSLIKTKYLHSTTHNSKHFESCNEQHQFYSKKNNLNDFNSNSVSFQVKMNRIQSEYIRPINSSSMSRTPKINKTSTSKVNIDSCKLKKQLKQLHANQYCDDFLGQKLKKKAQRTNFSKQCEARALEKFIKKSLKTFKTESKSIKREQSSNYNMPVGDSAANNKQIQKKPQKIPNTQFKKKSKRSSDIRIIGENVKNQTMRKNPSTCLVKNYYILHKNKQEKKSQKKAITLTTNRGVPNPQQSYSVDKYTSSKEILNLGNNSSDSSEFNCKNSQSDKKKMILQRIQRTLESYRVSLDEQVKKRRSLQIENQILKEELYRLIKINK